MGEQVYIYGLHAPDDHDVMYVGSTLNPSAILSQHISQPANAFEPVSQYYNRLKVSTNNNRKRYEWLRDMVQKEGNNA